MIMKMMAKICGDHDDHDDHGDDDDGCSSCCLWWCEPITSVTISHEHFMV